VATCTTASISVDMFLTSENNFDFYKLKGVAKKITYDLNKIIENNNAILNEVNFFTFS
jgi:hypothetical protein